MRLSLIFVFPLVMGSCSDNDDKTTTPDQSVDPPTATGVVYYQSALKMNNAYSNLKTALEKNENISIVKEFDHSKNAASVEMDLAPTQIIFFGNPLLGTPLMQKNQLIGLDLPQKVLFYEDEDEVFALYNSIQYLASRYGVGEVESLSQISDALNNLVGTAVDAQPEQTLNQNVDLHEGIISVESTTDFESTYNNLRASIEANENLSIVTELDHQQNAENVGMELLPTRVIMFGNPKLGTPLMQSIRSIGLDLPQKMLVWEDADGTVHISYNNPVFLKEKHQLEGNNEQIEKISNALGMLANSAAEIE
jgi:uncharacterized protein (DUF302 family)